MNHQTRDLTVPLRELLGESGIKYKTTHRSYVFTCPLCKKKDKLYIFRDGRGYKCFVCAENGIMKGSRVEWCLTHLLNIPVTEIKQKLYSSSFREGEMMKLNLVHPDDDFEELLEGESTIEEMVWSYHHYEITDPRSIAGVRYLETRGIPLSIAAEYGIRYSPVEQSVCFPILMGGTLVGWQGRLITPEVITLPDGRLYRRPKIMSTISDGVRGKAVMFENRLHGVQTAVVCEGPVDAIKCHMYGGNVATMGKAIGEGQIKTIIDSGVSQVVLALDPDVGHTEFESVAQRFMRYGVQVLTVDIGGYKDLGDMTFDDAYAALRAAQPYQARSRIPTLLVAP